MRNLNQIEKDSETVECESESGDSIDEESLVDSTEVPGKDSLAEGLSEAESDASVTVRQCLWDFATSQEHQMTHRPALPYHCHECMIAEDKRKRRASKGQPKEAKRFGDSMSCDHVYMKDWLGHKGVDGVPDIFNVLDIAIRMVYSFPVHSKDAVVTVIALSRCKGRAKIKHM